MAIYYHNDYSKLKGRQNFGDDINPQLLGNLFEQSLLNRSDVCVVGIGTILNQKNIRRISEYKQKVVFSSGVGYGELPPSFDSTWEFVCVRGPMSAKALGIPVEKGVCDGAILLALQHEPLKRSLRDGIVFIPHVHSAWSSGFGLKQICDELSIKYLPPDVPFNIFIDGIRSASLVVTEAMHGAIVADALRTPWISCDFIHHHAFKWQDWFGSIEVPYVTHSIAPAFWSGNDRKFVEKIKKPLRHVKMKIVKKKISKLIDLQEPSLSLDAVISDRINRLVALKNEINERYG